MPGLSLNLGLGLGSVFGSSLGDTLLSRLQSGRVDFIGLGDSNQSINTLGWDHGFRVALESVSQMFASGFYTVNSNNANGADLGTYTAYNSAQSLFGTTSGAPIPLREWLNSGGTPLANHKYGYLASGTFAAGSESGLISLANSPLGNSGELQYDLHYGTITFGAGQSELSVRLQDSPNTELATSGVFTNFAAEYDMAVQSLTLPAGTVTDADPVNFRFVSDTNGADGPFFAIWQRIHRPDRTTGYSYHSLSAYGGGTARTLALSVQSLTHTALAYYIDEMRKLQGATKTIVIVINAGINDRSETATSVGPEAITDGDSPEAYVDNIQAIVNVFESVYTTEGWDSSELHFVIMPSHVIAEPDDAEIVSYRAGVVDRFGAKARTQIIDFSDYFDQAAMLSNGYYASSGSDKLHLSQDGYEGLATAIMPDLLGTPPSPSLRSAAIAAWDNGAGGFHDGFLFDLNDPTKNNVEIDGSGADVSDGSLWGRSQDLSGNGNHISAPLDANRGTWDLVSGAGWGTLDGVNHEYSVGSDVSDALMRLYFVMNSVDGTAMPFTSNADAYFMLWQAASTSTSITNAGSPSFYKDRVLQSITTRGDLYDAFADFPVGDVIGEIRNADFGVAAINDFSLSGWTGGFKFNGRFGALACIPESVVAADPARDVNIYNFLADTYGKSLI